MLPERAVYFVVMVILTLIGLIWGLIDTRRVIEAPFLYATGMALILCPQLYLVTLDSSRVPDQAFWVFSSMVVLCTVALYLGYFPRPSHRPRKGPSAHARTVNHVRLYALGLGSALAGAFGAYNISAMGTITEWRGWAVYWYSLSCFIVPGITLMLIAYVHARKVSYLLPIVVFSLQPFLTVTDAGRRAATLTLPLVYALPFLLYKKNFRIPRWAIPAGLVLAFIVVYAFPVWRDRFKSHDYVDVVESHPLSEIIENTFNQDSNKPLEIADGMIVTGATYQTGSYQWGVISLYNQLIEGYVPGSLIGRDLKDSMRIGEGLNNDWVTNVYGIPVAYYTAKSGYTDLFTQFSFLGSFVMYWIGKGFRKANDAAVLNRDARAVIFLCFFFSFPASIAYTSLIYSVVTQIPQIALMLVAFRWCTSKSKVHRKTRRMQSISVPSVHNPIRIC